MNIILEVRTIKLILLREVDCLKKKSPDHVKVTLRSGKCGAGIPLGSKEKKASCLEVSIEEKFHHTLCPD